MSGCQNKQKPNKAGRPHQLSYYLFLVLCSIRVTCSGADKHRNGDFSVANRVLYNQTTAATHAVSIYAALIVTPQRC